jgi:uncharacterized protein YkwD
MTAPRLIKPVLAPLVALLAALVLSACSMSGGGSSPGALAPALSARMDQPGARLDQAQAIGMINAYRATAGLPALTPDAALEGTAQALANQYAQTGTPPRTPQGLTVMKLSAGYATFAETFSGWRNNPADAAGLRANAAKAGLAMAFNASSSYGIHWVLVLDQ